MDSRRSIPTGSAVATLLCDGCALNTGGLYLYDEKVDAFSFAMIMHEMASRRKPWEAELGRGATSAEITKYAASSLDASAAAGPPLTWCCLLAAGSS